MGDTPDARIEKYPGEFILQIHPELVARGLWVDLDHQGNVTAWDPIRHEVVLDEDAGKDAMQATRAMFERNLNIFCAAVMGRLFTWPNRLPLRKAMLWVLMLRDEQITDSELEHIQRNEEFALDAIHDRIVYRGTEPYVAVVDLAEWIADSDPLQSFIYIELIHALTYRRVFALLRGGSDPFWEQTDYYRETLAGTREKYKAKAFTQQNTTPAAREAGANGAEIKPVAPRVITCVDLGIPAPAAWRDIKLKFVDGETLSVSVGAKHKRVSFSEMGFAKANGTSDVQWDLLRTLPLLDNGILAKENIPKAKRDATKKKVQRLSKTLRSFFQIDCDPIVTLEDNRGWQSILDIKTAD